MYYQLQSINQPNYIQPYLIEVSGKGVLQVPPDFASINLGVLTEHNELLQAQQLNSRTSNHVIQSLFTTGIPNQNIKTFDYRIESQYDFEQGKQFFRGYKVTHLLQVKIEDLSKIGNVVDSAVHHGANYVANVQFSIKNNESQYQRALSAAINDAVIKAQGAATMLKVSLQQTPVLLIEQSENNQSFLNQGATYVKGISTTAFEPGQLQITAKIIAHFRYSI